MNWQPTCELRWFDTTKTVTVDNSGFYQHYENGKLVTERQVTTRMLQQKWIKPYHPDYCTTIPEPFEWRDVPTEKAE